MSNYVHVPSRELVLENYLSSLDSEIIFKWLFEFPFKVRDAYNELSEVINVKCDDVDTFTCRLMCEYLRSKGWNVTWLTINSEQYVQVTLMPQQEH